MIYVDELIHPWRGKKWCHLMADDTNELHTFAQSIGLKPEWFQSHAVQPHYDIVESYRIKAIAKGAVEITTEQSTQRTLDILKERKAKRAL